MKLEQKRRNSIPKWQDSTYNLFSSTNIQNETVLIEKKCCKFDVNLGFNNESELI
jgi:hypothetical protein